MEQNGHEGSAASQGAQAAVTNEPGRLSGMWNGPEINVGDAERLASAIAGLGLAAYGLTKFSWKGLGLAALGSYLAYRGVSGYCPAFSALGISTTGAEPEGILVDKSITINYDREDLYKFWLDFENLPQFMDHLEAVWMVGDHRYHWVAKAPAGMSVEWDADVVLERIPDVIAWRSLPGSEIPNEGTVRFEDAPGGRGTVVHVSLRYYPPAGRIGAWIAKMFGEEPSLQVEQDLRHFKELMETGERPTIRGQSSGREEDN